jgi:transcriptional regulator with PAS, ATPase and Fis domain
LPDVTRAVQVKVLPRAGEAFPTLEGQEAELIRRALEHTRGNRSQAAEMLGIDRVSLWRKIKKYGLA